MIKLNVAYGKKVPGTQDYSSDSYHASVEIELSGDTSNWNEVNNAISKTFDDLKKSVEDQIAGKSVADNGDSTSADTVKTAPAGNTAGEHENKPSEKQLKYLLSLATRRGITPAQLAKDHGVASIDEMDKKTVSQIISDLKED